MPQAWQELIAAIKLLAKHQIDDARPFNCEHDVLSVMSDPSAFTKEELERLDSWGFFPSDDNSYFESFRYGSA